MTRTLAYNSANINQIYKNLCNYQKQGVDKEYEIKIDGFTVVSRTSDLEKYSLLIENITNFSSEINIFLYKGNSRRYDKYIFHINKNKSPNPELSIDEYIQQEVNKRFEAKQKELELHELRKLKIEQNELITKLKSEIEKLKSKNTGAIKDILTPFLKGSIPTVKPQDVKISGIPATDLAKMIVEAKNKYGEGTMNEVLGVAFQLAEDPNKLKEVQKIINDKK